MAILGWLIGGSLALFIVFMLGFYLGCEARKIDDGGA